MTASGFWQHAASIFFASIQAYRKSVRLANLRGKASSISGQTFLSSFWLHFIFAAVARWSATGGITVPLHTACHPRVQILKESLIIIKVHAWTKFTSWFFLPNINQFNEAYNAMSRTCNRLHGHTRMAASIWNNHWLRIDTSHHHLQCPNHVHTQVYTRSYVWLQTWVCV